MEIIRSLGDTGFETLFNAFNDAFCDYEIQVNRKELSIMLERRGFSPGLSFGAFDDEKLVAFTCNGTGMFKGVNTAYDTGTGTIGKYRGKGLATKIFEYSLPFMKQNGIRQYLLEVLQHNPNAIKVYTNLGFNVSREFNYFKQNVDEVKLNAHVLPAKFHIQETGLNHKDEMALFWDFIPSWQNSFEAISRRPDDFKMVAAFEGRQLIGYGIVEPESGDITQLAVSKTQRRQGIGSGILKEMIRLNKFGTVKAINTEITCTAITHFFESNNIPLKGKQFEMVKAL